MEEYQFIEELGLREITDISTALWDSNFCDLDQTYSLTPNYSSVWTELSELCTNTKNSASPAGGLWNLLMQQRVNTDCIATAVFIVLLRQPNTYVEKEASFLASTCYLSILGVEGASVYKLFHPIIFQKCMDVLALLQERSSAHPPVRATQDDTIEDMDIDISPSENDPINSTDQLVQLARSFINELIYLLQAFSFQGHLESLSYLIQCLISLITASSETSGSNILNTLAWKCLSNVTAPAQGPEKNTLREIFKNLLPLLILGEISDRKRPVTIPKINNKLSQQTMVYIKSLVEARLMEREAKSAMHILIRHICVRIPTQANFKIKICKTASEVVTLLPDRERVDFYKWLDSFFRSRMQQHRNVGVTLIGELISTESNRELQITDGKLLPVYLMEFLITLCSDVSPTVRGNALHVLSCVINSPHYNNQDINVFMINYLHQSTTSASNLNNTFLDMLARRLRDEKANVRKNAIEALESVLSLAPAEITLGQLNLIQSNSHDPSLMARKQVIIALKNLLYLQPSSLLLQKQFLAGVLPLTLDRESSVQDKCREAMFEVLFSKLLPYSAEAEVFNLSWTLLSLICSSSEADYQGYFQMLCQQLVKAKLLSKTQLNTISSYLQSAESSSVSWIILACLSKYCTDIEVGMLYAKWTHIIESSDSINYHESNVFHMISTLANLHTKLTNQQNWKILLWLSGVLNCFSLPSEKINIGTNAMLMICTITDKSSKDSQDRQKWLTKWSEEIVSKSTNFISKWVDEYTENPDWYVQTEDQVITYLTMLGEMSAISPSYISYEVTSKVQWLMLSNRNSTGLASPLSDRLRAFACIVFGKLCLVQENMAVKCPAILVDELFTTTSPIVKSNIVVVLCDLCIRYSSLVDNYLSYVSVCLKDASYLVKRQSLIMLTSLIQEDFIKLRSSLIQHLLSVIVDTELNEIGEYALQHVVLKKYPKAFFQHFIESIFFLNDNRNHLVYNQFPQLEMEREVFKLTGQNNTKKRFKIYYYMIQHLTDDQKFDLSTKLVQEVFGSVLDNAFKLTEDNYPVIKDCLSILCSKEIKVISQKKQTSSENIDDDEPDQIQELAEAAHSKIIAEIVKKNVIENIIPTIIALKRQMDKCCSPLLGDVMAYLKTLKYDFKDQFSEVMSGDKQLAEEIEFDTRRYEEEQEQMRRAKSVRNTLQSPLLSPHLSINNVSRNPDIDENVLQCVTPRRLLALKSASKRSKKMTPLFLSQSCVDMASPDLQIRMNKNPQISNISESIYLSNTVNHSASATEVRSGGVNTIYQSPQKVIHDIILNTPRTHPAVITPLSQKNSSIKKVNLPNGETQDVICLPLSEDFTSDEQDTCFKE